MRIKRAMLFTLAAMSLLAQKKEAPPSQTWPTSRVFAASCDAVWPAALRVAMDSGWSVKTSDRAGGIMTLESTAGEQTGRYKHINPLVGKYTVEKSTGFWTQYTGFRMAGASLTLIPGKGIPAGQDALVSGTCEASITVTYHGLEQRAPGGLQWWILKTNGWLEDKMLGEIEAKLQK